MTKKGHSEIWLGKRELYMGNRTVRNCFWDIFWNIGESEIGTICIIEFGDGPPWKHQTAAYSLVLSLVSWVVYKNWDAYGSVEMSIATGVEKVWERRRRE